MSSSIFENIFSFGKQSKKPIGDQPSVSYDIVKTNRHGKKQDRKLCFASDGVRNMSGSYVKWYINKNDILGFTRDSPNSTSFTMFTVQRFHFAAKSEEQLSEIFDSVNQYSLGNEELAKGALELTVYNYSLFVYIFLFLLFTFLSVE